jgi:hypothetical protein
VTATHATVTGLITRTKNLEHKLYIDNLSSPDLPNDSHMKAINCCGTVRPNQKGLSNDSGRKRKLKWADTNTRMKGDSTAIVWEDK